MVTDESTEANPEEHHVIGKSQNFPVHIPAFLRENQGDPAIKVIPTESRCNKLHSHHDDSGLLAQA